MFCQVSNVLYFKVQTCALSKHTPFWFLLVPFFPSFFLLYIFIYFWGRGGGGLYPTIEPTKDTLSIITRLTYSIFVILSFRKRQKN